MYNLLQQRSVHTLIIYYLQVRFLLSPDEDFSQAGSNSGIMYAKSFKKYKEMLTEDPGSRMYTRIFSEFNASLFGTAPTLSNDFVVDDGDYDSEVERFKRDTRAESPVEDAPNMEIDETTSILSSPAQSHQSDHHVSVSVVSRVSHTIASSSQVSNVVNSSITVSSEREVRESSPPAQVAVRPLPTKISGSKTSKSTTAASDPNPETAPTRRKKANATPVESSQRTLRKRA